MLILKTFVWVSKTAHWIKILTTKSELSLIPRTQVREEKNQLLQTVP